MINPEDELSIYIYTIIMSVKGLPFKELMVAKLKAKQTAHKSNSFVNQQKQNIQNFER